jgi:hypothetical protein
MTRTFRPPEDVLSAELPPGDAAPSTVPASGAR